MGNADSSPSLSTFPQPSPLGAHLPDELLLEILSYLSPGRDFQSTLASFCLVCKQWYNVGISLLYESPYLAGRSYDLFVQTICPSINAHILKSELAGLVKELDLSHIVHQGNKAITARLLGRTKQSLEVFIAPQASFAINCWAALSKCSKLRYLNLSLVSECIAFQSLNQTVRQLPELTHLYLPRSSSSYNSLQISMNIKWPPKLKLLQLAGGVHGKFIWDLNAQPNNFPPTLTHLSISHCPHLEHWDIKSLLKNLSRLLHHLELRNLPQVKQGKLNGVLDWVPHLQSLIICTDYIDINFGSMPSGFNPSMWAQSKPLERLTLLTSGAHDPNDQNYFMPVDMWEMLEQRYLGRLRWVLVAKSTQWPDGENGAELDALEGLLHEVDKENWERRRWHYEDLQVPSDWIYERWYESPQGKRMRPGVRVLRDQ
ncbi:hypothetical protein K469DRAFT_717041 [Zopfia rhizophila CBS 207.26]|uniref:F-box domain-containing protein n=1 Tax=Zopfia rhizophila CBS 207.26 TaxID=1314779 RepID=A0A6A6EP69_9PEZI|nr:hypothetical protein K469DRAFT_717041 [Zopfia rhizophila CBS 207.26]